MSWKPEVLVDGKWASNSLRFATKAEAERSAKQKFNDWFAVTDYRATESDDPVTHQMIAVRTVPVERAA